MMTDLFLVHILILLPQHLNVNQIQVVVRRCSTPNVTEETTYFIPRNPVVDAGTNTDPPVVCCPLLRRFCPCPPRGLLASLVTKRKRCGNSSRVSEFLPGKCQLQMTDLFCILGETQQSCTVNK